VPNSDHLKWCLQEDQIELDTPNQMLAEDYQAKAREALAVAALLETTSTMTGQSRHLIMPDTSF